MGRIRIGRVRAESISKFVCKAGLVGLSDPCTDRKTGEWIQSLGLPESAIVTENDILLNDDSIDAVLICLPANTHDGLIQKTAEAGKHIFCEKPIHLNQVKLNEIT